ncbi:TPA: hypothetical protein ACH3X1_000681 [Trebouxia sp. C0004]
MDFTIVCKSHEQLRPQGFTPLSPACAGQPGKQQPEQQQQQQRSGPSNLVPVTPPQGLWPQGFTPLTPASALQPAKQQPEQQQQQQRSGPSPLPLPPPLSLLREFGHRTSPPYPNFFNPSSACITATRAAAAQHSC